MPVTIPLPKKPIPSLTAERLAVSRREAAAMLGVSERSIDNWAKAGKLTARKIGARVLFSVQALQEFLNNDSTDVHD